MRADETCNKKKKQSDNDEKLKRGKLYNLTMIEGVTSRVIEAYDTVN
jgi:hypothetical protein